MTTVDTSASPPIVEAPISLRSTTRGGRLRDGLLKALLLLAVALSLLMLFALLAEMLIEGAPVLRTRLWGFLTGGLNSSPAVAGVWQGIKGTLMLVVIVAFVAFPLGVGAAIHLEEYAGDTRFARIVDVNIRNLAGVPSIVYGLLGLSIFVYGIGALAGGRPFRTVIAGGLTLGVLVLPIVIITAQEALRAVPSGIREGALALGATRWETIRHHIMPAATPGILTGTVLSLARAAGEAAPLLVVGAVTGVFFVGSQGLVEQIVSGRFTALPMIIFVWARLPAGQGWGVLAGAAAFILLLIVVLVNLTAIMLRNRYEQKW